jgi:hypothetical protein
MVFIFNLHISSGHIDLNFGRPPVLLHSSPSCDRFRASEPEFADPAGPNVSICFEVEAVRALLPPSEAYRLPLVIGLLPLPVDPSLIDANARSRSESQLGISFVTKIPVWCFNTEVAGASVSSSAPVSTASEFAEALAFTSDVVLQLGTLTMIHDAIVEGE